MRTAALLLLFVAFGYAAKSQKFSLLPSVGFENSKTKVLYNNQHSFAPAGVVFSPQAALQLNYQMKSGHGFYLGAASSRSTVNFRFSDPETGMSNYQATTGNMQVRLEGGYQFSSKPIYFKNPGNSKTKPGTTSASTSPQKKSCGTYSYRAHCMKPGTTGSKSAAEKSAVAKNKGGWMKLQPSVGMGYIPSTMTDVITKSQSGQASYEYRAGNWSTALMTGMAVEFGKNSHRLATVSFNYMRGIGNLNTQTISSVVGSKTMTTQLSSEVSGWNMRVGIPFNLGAKKPAKPVEKNVQKSKPGCSQYRMQYRCSKSL